MKAGTISSTQETQKGNGTENKETGEQTLQHIEKTGQDGMIAVEAYVRAEERGFGAGKEVDGRLVAGGSFVQVTNRTNHKRTLPFAYPTSACSYPIMNYRW